MGLPWFLKTPLMIDLHAFQKAHAIHSCWWLYILCCTNYNLICFPFFYDFFPKIFLKLDFQNKAKTNIVFRLGMAGIMILSKQITPLFSNWPETVF